MDAKGVEGDLLDSAAAASPAELAKALDEIAASTAEQLLDLRARLLAAERRLESLEAEELPQNRERGKHSPKASGGKRTKADKAAAEPRTSAGGKKDSEPAGRRRTTAELKAGLTREQIEQIREERRLARPTTKPKKR